MSTQQKQIKMFTLKFLNYTFSKSTYYIIKFYSYGKRNENIIMFNSLYSLAFVHILKYIHFLKAKNFSNVL